MNSVKQTLGAGAGMLLVGLLLLAWLDQQVKMVLGGAITILLLLLGVVFVWMGLVSLREERENERKEKAEAERQEAMAAGDASG